MYTAVDLSKYIVTKCWKEDCPISNLQLQKILYFIQKAFLKQGKRAFSDEMEAWQFGPVVPNVYYKFCGFGSMPITSDFEAADIAQEDLAVIDQIVEEKRVLDPWDLVADAHKANGAWNEVFQGGLGNHKTIPIERLEAEE